MSQTTKRALEASLVFVSRKGLNIYKRKDGRWEARYIKSRNALGKPKYGYLYASSYREVRCDLQHTLQLQGKPSGSEERTRNSTFELVSMEWLDAFPLTSRNPPTFVIGR